MMERKWKNGNYASSRRETTWKQGWREVGGKRIYFRSKWEANYGRYLQFLLEKEEIQNWEHEPDIFWFEGIRRGCVSYLPDFKVVEKNGETTYHEVKGWMDAKSKTKLKRMKKYHPNVKLVVIQAEQYREIGRKLGGLIEGWE